MAQKKDLWDILSSISTLISGVLLAGVGTAATIAYNNQQIELAKIEVLDKYRDLLQSPNETDRTFSFQVFVALGYEQLALQIVFLSNDRAGKSVVASLTESGDPQIQEAAKRILVTLQETERIQAIVNIFEFGATEGDYGAVMLLAGDSGHLTYGRAQTTLASGNLYLLIEKYIRDPAAKYANKFTPYLMRLESQDITLDHDMTFRGLLRDAAEDPAMQRAQDEMFRRMHFDPALRSAETLGIETPLGLTVVYDSVVHGSFGRIRDKTTRELAGTPLTGVDEKKWIRKYLELRREWLLAHPNTLLHRTVYRVDTLIKLVDEGKWNLEPPLNIRGVAISEEK